MKSNEPENLKGKYTSVSIQVQKIKKNSAVFNTNTDLSR